jgi:NAD(P)-dependent dehydrogenase (short-subunit alcohol dehydrogenase family)
VGICPAEVKQPSDELFEHIMALSTTGTFNIGSEAIRRMVQQEQRQVQDLIPGTERNLPAGSIVNIGSGASLWGIPDMAVYCASNHAVLGLTRSWAKDWPSLRARVFQPRRRTRPFGRRSLRLSLLSSSSSFSLHLAPTAMMTPSMTGQDHIQGL